ncbi:MAG: transposase [Bdellovibrionales bacterium]|nr:transposase [Bdellovibrionales bacterium]
MPRKSIIYTHLYPYHVYARSNNREWFYLPKEIVWNIFVKHLTEASLRFRCEIISFMLMDNHYHLIIFTHEEFLLGVVMQYLQMSVSRSINRLTNRTNHVFGGPYKASLIKSPQHFADIYKYVYRNPVEANIVGKVEDYAFSSLIKINDIPLSSPSPSWSGEIPKGEEFIQWLNSPIERKYIEALKLGLQRTTFKPTFRRGY